jgi:hypothetical protein
VVVLAVLFGLLSAVTFEFEVSLPLLAQDTFHGTSTTYSWLLSAMGAGAVAGGLAVAFFDGARSARTGVARLVKAALRPLVFPGRAAALPAGARPGRRGIRDRVR